VKNNSNIRLVSGEAPSRLLEPHSAARMHLAKLAHQVGDTSKARPAFVVLEKLNEKLRVAFSRPAADSTGADLPKWMALAGRLRADPLAKLED
jgi:hypothetical protein